MSYSGNDTTRDVSDGYSLWLVDSMEHERYVEATSAHSAEALMLIVFDEPVISVRPIDEENIGNAVRGDEPPFGCLSYLADGQVVEYEKRVNQAGFKGIYERYHEVEL